MGGTNRAPTSLCSDAPEHWASGRGRQGHRLRIVREYDRLDRFPVGRTQVSELLNLVQPAHIAGDGNEYLARIQCQGQPGLAWRSGLGVIAEIRNGVVIGIIRVVNRQVPIEVISFTGIGLAVLEDQPAVLIGRPIRIAEKIPSRVFSIAEGLEGSVGPDAIADVQVVVGIRSHFDELARSLDHVIGSPGLGYQQAGQDIRLPRRKSEWARVFDHFE